MKSINTLIRDVPWAEKKRRYKAKYPKRYLLTNAKSRARKKQIPFELSEEDINIPEMCPVLKTPFAVDTDYAMSLDRLDNSKGYVKDNIAVISLKANNMKRDASPEELRNFAQWALSQFKH